MRVFIGNRSSTNILYMSAFEKLGIRRDKLQQTIAPLMGFTRDKLYPTGVLTLPVTIGVNPRQVTKVVDFLVVDCPSAYNTIIS